MFLFRLAHSNTLSRIRIGVPEDETEFLKVLSNVNADVVLEKETRSIILDINASKPHRITQGFEKNGRSPGAYFFEFSKPADFYETVPYFSTITAEFEYFDSSALICQLQPYHELPWPQYRAASTWCFDADELKHQFLLRAKSAQDSNMPLAAYLKTLPAFVRNQIHSLGIWQDAIDKAQTMACKA